MKPTAEQLLQTLCDTLSYGQSVMLIEHLQAQYPHLTPEAKTHAEELILKLSSGTYQAYTPLPHLQPAYNFVQG